MTALPPPSTPRNAVRKPNPVTGWIDRHKRLTVGLVVGLVVAVVGLGAIFGGSTKSEPKPSRSLSVCETVAEWPGATRSDLIDLVLKSNPAMSRREAQNVVDASRCAPR